MSIYKSQIRYRDHKGSLEESLKTICIFHSIEEIKEHLNELYNQFGMSVEEIKFIHMGKDDRTGWDEYYVLQRLNGESAFTVAGMSDGFLVKYNK